MWKTHMEILCMAMVSLGGTFPLLENQWEMTQNQG